MHKVFVHAKQAMRPSFWNIPVSFPARRKLPKSWISGFRGDGRAFEA
jgi:hypothetical protein